MIPIRRSRMATIHVAWGRDMQKVNGMPLYWLGHALGQLFASLNPPVMLEFLQDKLVLARNNLEWFSAEIKALPLSRGAAADVLVNVNNILKLQGDKGLSVTGVVVPHETAGALYFSIVNLQAVLGSELPQANYFYATPKRVYDMSALIERGEDALSPGTLNLLKISHQDVIKEMREAARCLAFNVPTAVGFHLYRGIEAIIVGDYFSILGITDSDVGNNKNLGAYIKLLQAKGVSVKVTGMLEHLKDNYRNPIMHPEEFWDSDEAENAFSAAVSIINIMVQDIDGINKRTAALTL